MSNPNWLDLSGTSNRYVQMYVKGFVDVSGGNITLRPGITNNNHLIVQGGDISLNGRLFSTGTIQTLGAVALQNSSSVISPNTTAATQATWTNNDVTWTASASSVLGGGAAFVAFNTTSDIWHDDVTGYAFDTGIANGNFSTTVFTNGSSGATSTYYGQWLQIQSSNAASIQSFYFGGRVDFPSRLPAVFYIVGSNTGTEPWTPIFKGDTTSTTGAILSGTVSLSGLASSGTISNFYGTTLLTYTTYGNLASSFTYFRLIVSELCGNDNTVNIGEWGLTFTPMVSTVSLALDTAIPNQLNIVGSTRLTNTNPSTMVVTPVASISVGGGVVPPSSWTTSNITWTAVGTNPIGIGETGAAAFDLARSTVAANTNNFPYMTIVGRYNSTTGAYTGTQTTTNIDGATTINGEYLQIQSSIPLIFKNYNFLSRWFNASPFSYSSLLPASYRIVASNDGISWVSIHDAAFTAAPISTSTSLTTSQPTLFYNITTSGTATQQSNNSITGYAAAANAYTYFRIIVKTMIGTQFGFSNPQNDTRLNFFWTPYFVPASSAVSLALDSTVVNQLNLNGKMLLTSDANINGLTVGRGSGNMSQNTAVGYEALLKNTSSNNTAVGHASLSNTTGANNTAVGQATLTCLANANNNTAAGTGALYNTTTGGNNTALGYQAGNTGTPNTTGSNNTFLGYETGASGTGADNYSNSTAIGSGAKITASNQIVLGTASETVSIPGSLVGKNINGVGGTVYTHTSPPNVVPVTGSVLSVNTSNLLPSSTGSYLPLLSLRGNSSGNNSFLNIFKYRYSTGDTWVTSSTRIQQVIDGTNQACIEFNPPGANYGLGLYAGGSNSLASLSPNGITILQNGNVGIGRSDPVSKLEVAGTITAPALISPSDLRIISNSDIRIYANPSNTLYLNNDRPARSDVRLHTGSLYNQTYIDNGNLYIENGGIRATNGLTLTGGPASIIPTSTYVFGSTNNFLSDAITNPPVQNGIFSGTADLATAERFNLAIGSWFGIGFVDTCFKKCHIYMNVRTGNINATSIGLGIASPQYTLDVYSANVNPFHVCSANTITGASTNGISNGNNQSANGLININFAPQIQYSSNSGASYTNSSLSDGNTSGAFVMCGMSYTGQYIVVGGLGYGRAGLLYSSNYGQSFTPSNITSKEPSSGSLSFTGQYGVATANGGGALAPLYTSNYGQTWTSSNLPSNKNYIIINSFQTGQYAVAGFFQNNSGTIYYSSNYGQNYTASNAPSAGWDTLVMSNTGQYCMATTWQYQNGSTVQGIYYSTSFGQTWAQSNITTGYGKVVISYDGQYGIGTFGTTIYYSNNYGQTWSTTQPAGWSSSLFSYRFATSVDALTVTNPNGYVGIGTTSPLNILDVAKTSIGLPGAIFRGAALDSAKALLSTVGYESAALPPASGGGTLYFYYYQGTMHGGPLHWKVTFPATPYFTGQHGNYTIDQDLKTNLVNYVGLLVSSADEGYYSTNQNTREVTTGKDAITITEALPKVILTAIDKDPAVWGVVSNVKNDDINPDGTIPTDDNPEFASRLNEHTIRINGVGEGALWVTNINGNIKNGDWICSSIVPGYGRKQDDDLFHNYTAAKATMSCNFDINNDNLYQCKEVEFNGTTYLAAFIGVSYHCS